MGLLHNDETLQIIPYLKKIQKIQTHYKNFAFLEMAKNH